MEKLQINETTASDDLIAALGISTERSEELALAATKTICGHIPQAKRMMSDGKLCLDTSRSLDYLVNNVATTFQEQIAVAYAFGSGMVRAENRGMIGNHKQKAKEPTLDEMLSTIAQQKPEALVEVLQATKDIADIMEGRSAITPEDLNIVAHMNLSTEDMCALGEHRDFNDFVIAAVKLHKERQAEKSN